MHRTTRRVVGCRIHNRRIPTYSAPEHSPRPPRVLFRAGHLRLSSTRARGLVRTMSPSPHRNLVREEAARFCGVCNRGGQLPHLESQHNPAGLSQPLIHELSPCRRIIIRSRNSSGSSTHQRLLRCFAAPRKLVVLSKRPSIATPTAALEL